MFFRFAGAVAILAMSFVIPVSLHAQSKTLEAGIARVDLTPPLSMKASLGGYGARMSKPAEGIHDRVWLKCIVLQQDGKRLALVTADSLCFPPPVRQAVMAKLKEKQVNVDEVMILPSHTHNSFDLFALHPKNIFRIPQIGIFQQAAFDHVVARLVDVVVQANNKFQPVKTGTGRIDLTGWNRNRRKANISDPDFTITRIDNQEGKPIAALVFWSAHPTFLSAREMQFSGDWPGQLQRTLESLIGPGATVMFVNGAQGDQSPTPRYYSGESNWEKAEDYGRDIAIQGYNLWQKITPTENSPLAWKRQVFALPKRSVHKDFLKSGGLEYGFVDKALDPILMSLYPTESQTLSVRLGDLQIVGVPGEMIAQLGMQVKKEVQQATGAKYVVIGGLADEWISYILTSAEYNKGGYEATISFYGETLGETIVDAVIKNASELK
ncbi:MAG: neutral/alkaline non-lysosomal ceramidase N-terminal domain-containing protein [Planctomycetia bacterium]|nr:neutral/alkaline non-lysosomal ceramidase N-terminal domain-containing protein [Planctomycetia bacterium]